MNNKEFRMRPAGESSDEDEFGDYMSENYDAPLNKNAPTVNPQEWENERIFKLFLNSDLTDIIALLDEGFDVNKRLRDNWTPLLLAASVGAPDITAELISKGADVNMHRDYYTPLMAASACPPFTSSEENSLAVVRQLLNKGVNVNAKTRKRMNALMFAASVGNCKIVKELLPHCDKTAEDNQGWTALFWAINGNSLDVVQLLLEEGLPYNKFDVRGNLPAFYATENGFDSIADILPSLKEEDDQHFETTEYGYQDFFESGRTDFIQDVATMLYGMRNDRNVHLFVNKKINLLKFLTLNENDLKDMNIGMPYLRYQILSNIHKFHKYPFKTKALPIVGKTEPYSTLNVANTILSACRQLIAMRASLMYVLRNMEDVEETTILKKQLSLIRESLNKIKNVVKKINAKAIDWDLETQPADLITKDSLKKFKPSKLKLFCTVNMVAAVVYMIWKNSN